MKNKYNKWPCDIFFFQILSKKYNILLEENKKIYKEKEDLDIVLKDLEERLDENNKNLEMLKNKANEIPVNLSPALNTIIKYQTQLHEITPNKNNEFNGNEEISDFNLKSSDKGRNLSLENLENLNIDINLKKELEEFKEENLFLKNLSQQKEFEINELHSIIKMLEEKQNEFQQIQDENNSEMEILKNTMVLKEDTIKELNESIYALNEKINLFQNEIFSLNNRMNFEQNKKLEEFDILKKENIETKNRYEKEFELIASSIYNLGLNYWSLKLSTSNEVNEKPSWLKRERRKYYDGDL